MNSSATSVRRVVTCNDRLIELLPCSAYLTKATPSPSPACCFSVKELNAKANTTAIRSEYCKCFKSAIVGNLVDASLAKGLPGL
ncbi:unnamed protein product [Linum tenue]|nr:unnamed protein product [Linum tenue]